MLDLAKLGEAPTPWSGRQPWYMVHQPYGVRREHSKEKNASWGNSNL